MPNPAGLSYAKVVGRYQMFVADTVDGDDLPDFINLEGSGTIVPDILEARNTNPGLTSVYLPDPIPVEVVDGVLTQGANPYVMLLRSSPGVTPSGFTYRISLSLRPVGTELSYVQYGPFSFMADPDSGTGDVDLAIVTPVLASDGTASSVGPQGEQGPPGVDGTNGTNGTDGHNPITVSATAPVSPLEGDIWFDIP